ncbi:MAG: hypothetical protein L6M37_03575 [Candidatus Methylarchaceae archaeon HK02M1]|nr:hypothetical protein [Candidatus Methylarchaceae archaeon HK02M1]
MSIEDLKLGIDPGFIFFWNRKSIKECLDKCIFGTIEYLRKSVLEIFEDDLGFLYHYDSDILYGIWKSTSPGGYNLDPTFCSDNGGKSRYPYQVKVKRLIKLHIHDARSKLQRSPYNQFMIITKKFIKTRKKTILLKSWQVKELGMLLSKMQSSDDCVLFLRPLLERYGNKFVSKYYPDCWPVQTK